MSAFLLALCLTCTLPIDSSYIAEADTVVYIDNVFIIGNEKTKPAIILREMSVRKGETYSQPELDEILGKDRSKLLNTRLFNSVDISLLYLDQSTVDVIIKVSERWYTFPAPIFDLVDRNFNDWWQNQNRDLSRTNYGVRIFKNNFRGRNEQLRLILQFGFTREFGFGYQIPYIDKKKRHGINFNYSYAENKNVATQTIGHKPQFFDSEDVLRIQREYLIGYTFRRSFYTTHSLNIGFNDNMVSDTIAYFNPGYFNDGTTHQKYVELRYKLVVDRRNFASYPLYGYRTEAEVSKEGLLPDDDVNRLELNVNHATFHELGKKYYFSNYSSVFASFPTNQPYFNYGALGFGKDFIRGYELYLIEGKSFYLNRSTLKKRIFSKVFQLGIMPVKQFRKLPLDIYIKTYYDMGYVENYTNYDLNSRLSDRYLFGTGFGLDIVSYYDTVIRMEYTINRQKERGFFLHFRKEF